MGSLEDRPSSQLSSAVSCLRKKGKKKNLRESIKAPWRGCGGGGAALSAVNQGGAEVPFSRSFCSLHNGAVGVPSGGFSRLHFFHIKRGVGVATGAGSFSKVERSPPGLIRESVGMAGLADGKSISNRVCASALLLSDQT